MPHPWQQHQVKRQEQARGHFKAGEVSLKVAQLTPKGCPGPCGFRGQFPEDHFPSQAESVQRPAQDDGQEGGCNGPGGWVHDGHPCPPGHVRHPSCLLPPNCHRPTWSSWVIPSSYILLPHTGPATSSSSPAGLITDSISLCQLCNWFSIKNTFKCVPMVPD